ncbi:MAG: hypothetical protein ACAH21_14555 [Ramlibacter sp.]
MTQDVPLMGMGLIGFSPQQQEHLSNILSTRSHTLRWEVRPYLEADALWVNGERIQHVGDGLLRVPSQLPTSRAVRLNLNDIDRPVAMALPLAPGLEFPHVFDAHSAESVAAVFLKFEDTLRLLTAQLAVANVIADMDGSRTSTVYHLVNHGRLVALVNLRGDVGVASDAGAAEIEQADWHGMPAAAATIPETFIRCSIAEVMWQFATRSPRDVLPARYRKKPIHFRHAPAVRPDRVKDTHLVLVRELSIKPQTFAELQANTGLGDAAMASALAALYFVGSVTSDARRATPASGNSSLPPREPGEWSTSVAVPATEQDWNDPAPPERDDNTVPATLRPDAST